MSKPQLLIDTDPGVDDALAILMAYAHADIAGLSIAAGNVGLAHTVRNARTLVDLVGAATPVFAGCAAPLVRAADEDAAFVHGQDGFGDIGFAEPAAALADEPAALALLRLTRERPGELTLVALGPLTNLALALRLDPGLPERVARLVVMGGAVTAVLPQVGHRTPSGQRCCRIRSKHFPSSISDDRFTKGPSVMGTIERDRQSPS